MKKYSVLRVFLVETVRPQDNEVIFETNDFNKAKKTYKQLAKDIEFHEQKHTGASLVKNLSDDETVTLYFYAPSQFERK